MSLKRQIGGSSELVSIYMQIVTLPQKPKYSQTDKNSGRFEILGCYPGYGTTLGNALRRVLLSSLGGAAVSGVKIRGVFHEFSTINGIMEDVVQIILNIKKIRIKLEGSESSRLILKHKGEGKITAGSIKCPTGVKIVNPEQIIATATDKKTEIEMEFEVTTGLGYVPVEQQPKAAEKEAGMIAIDAIYTPIRRVNYEVENMRVGKRTDYEKITLDITTDGSISPQEAFVKAVKILVDQFMALMEVKENVGELTKTEETDKEKKDQLREEQQTESQDFDPLKIKVNELKNLSTRTLNVLTENKILRVKDIVKMSEEDIKKIEGMGEKGIKEIKKSIGEFGLTLKQGE